MNAINKLREILSGKKQYVFCLLLCLALRSLHEYNFPSIESDYSIQLEAAKNSIEGLGFVNTGISPHDLATPNMQELQAWPVGYSMLLIPFYMITKEWVSAHVLLQIFTIFILIIGIIKLFNHFNVSLLIINLFLIYFSFAPSPFYYLHTSDLLTGAVFLWIVYHTLKILENKGNIYINIIVVSLLCSFCALIRYACIPNLVIIPIVLFCMFILKRNFSIKPAIITAVLCGIIVFTFYHYYKILPGRTSFIQNLLSLNFDFSLLRWFDPFPIKALFYTVPVEFRFPPEKLFLISIYKYMLVIFSIFFTVYIFYIVFGGNYSIWKIDFFKKNQFAYFILIFIVSASVIISFLTIQSIAGEPEYRTFGPIWMPQIWTFVYNTRYFIYIIFLILVFFFIALNEIIIQKNKKHFFVLGGVYFAALAYAVLYWLYISYQIYSPNGNGGGSVRANMKEDLSIYYEINKYAQSNPNEKLVLVSNPELQERRDVLLFSKAFICTSYNNVINGDFNYSNPITLFVIFPVNNLTEEEQNFISHYSGEKIKNINNKTDLYKFKLN